VVEHGFHPVHDPHGLLRGLAGRGRDRPRGRPPHRSQRAGLPHWAPTSGEWRRSAPRGRDAARGFE
jgi:hypothetical protein